MTRHPSAPVGPTRRARLALLLAGALIAQAVAVSPLAAADRAPTEEAPADRTTELLPGVHYEEALAHANDRIAFRAGGRVDVAFRPRANDTALVGGERPRALPAGRATGKQMAAAAQGSHWTSLGTTEPKPAIDAPADPVPAATPVPATPEPSIVPSSEPVASSSAPPAPVDAPAVDPSAVVPADGAAAREPAVDTAAEPAATSLRKEVFGFLPYWELSDSSTTLDYSVLSTIAYFSVGADKAGNLMKKNSDGSTTTGWGGWTSSRLTNVINAAHLKGTRVVLTITSFAWSTSQANAQAALLGSSTARLNLARQAAAAVRDRGADGINLDFEPIASGYGDEFALLVKTVRAELDKIAKGYQLTFDTTGYIGNYPIEAATAPGAADAIFIMGYDFKTAGSNPTGSIAPLQGPYYDITQAVNAYRSRIPASKLILGVPYYGRAWSTETDKAHSKNISGTKYGSSSTAIYTSAISLASQHGRRWDSTEQSPYTVYRRQTCTSTYGCVTAWRQVWYDDASSLKQKYDLVNSLGLRGAGIWALGYDDGRTELNKALAEKFGGSTPAPTPTPAPTGAPTAGVIVLPWRHRDAGFPVRWTGTDSDGIANWDVQVSVDGGAFTTWLTRTTRTSEVYLGADGHGYAFRVRATDKKGNTSAWNTSATWKASPALGVNGFGGVKLTGLARRSAPSTSATQVGAMNAGQIVEVIGGPVVADGHTWWQVRGPVLQWRPVTTVSTFWLAQGPSDAPYLVASRAPNSTIVDAVLTDLSVGDADSATSSTGTVLSRTFSPNADGRRDALPVRWTSTSALDSLALKVFRANGTLVGSIPLDQTAVGTHQYWWDGRVGGTRVADGQYMLALAGTDGSATFSAPSIQPVTPTQVARFGVTVDTVAPSITAASLSNPAFSPNGDGAKDTVRLSVSAAGMTLWGVTVSPLSGAEAGGNIKSASGHASSASWTWDGRRATGSALADGAYRLAAFVSDAAGNRTYRNLDVRIDTTKPGVTASAAPSPFSPNGDKLNDTTALRWSADEGGSAMVRIIKGTAGVKTWAVGASGSLTWNGVDRAGKAAPDGTYNLRVDVTDAAGNTTMRYATFVIDRTASGLAWSPPLFYPHDGDALAAGSRVSYKLIRPAAVTMQVFTQDNRYIRTAWSNRSQAAGSHSWTWDGRAGTGAMVAPGWYRVVLTTKSWVGTTTVTKLVLVDAFTVVPSATTLVAGQTLKLDLRTAEPLRAAPRVTFAQAGKTAVTKTATLTSSGRYTVSFPVASGGPGVARVTVRGTDTGGRTNTTTASVTVK